MRTHENLIVPVPNFRDRVLSDLPAPLQDYHRNNNVPISIFARCLVARRDLCSTAGIYTNTAGQSLGELRVQECSATTSSDGRYGTAMFADAAGGTALLSRLSQEPRIRATALKSAFLANMSHELRTPLSAIIGYSEMLQKVLGEI